jgi:GntR family transcriptional regulator, trigonelline degradation regulator
VSRIPIREALISLEREGLVESSSRRSTVVARLKPALIGDIYEVRAAMDAYVASTLAARDKFNAKPLRQILTAGHAACRQGDLPSLIEMDFRFHMGTYEALGNLVIVDLMRGQWTHIKRAIALALTAATFAKDRFWEGHEAIFEAIVARNPERAHALALEHIQFARTVLLGGLGSAMVRDQPHATGRRRPRGRRAMVAASPFTSNDAPR